MAKNLKLNIKNTQIAKALNLDNVKEKLAQKKVLEDTKEEKKSKETAPVEKHSEEATPKIKARSKSVFSEPTHTTEKVSNEQVDEDILLAPIERESMQEDTSDLLPSEDFIEIPLEPEETVMPDVNETSPSTQEIDVNIESTIEQTEPISSIQNEEKPLPRRPSAFKRAAPPVFERAPANSVKLGPTGRHVNDLIPKKREVAPAPPPSFVPPKESDSTTIERAKPKVREESEEESAQKKAAKAGKFKEYRDLKPGKKVQDTRSSFDTRDRQGLRGSEDEQRWRKKRQNKQKFVEDAPTIRPSSLKIRLPISIKDLASEMKLKASQLIEKLFLQGAIFTLNDLLDDETTIQLLGHEFDCEITVDTTEEERIRITDKSIKEEIAETPPEKLVTRAPIAAFMGHVDHGKTSLIDAIRASNRVSSEAGAITQHIGAFKCKTAVGDITVLDTPGHEAFSEMRARGADVTDIVVLVVAGDEGIKEQTSEAIQHAKAAGVTIIVAINKCDKPNFDPDKVYRQLSEQDLLPEAWGGSIITVNCSAVTKEGIPELLEMLALQAEVLELKANPESRARGVVIESQMHKGMGAITTLLVQNGTLKHGDALVFDQHWGRVKTMRDEHGASITTAGPSNPVEITGLSGLPSAGQEFIVVENEKEARNIASARAQIIQNAVILRKPVSLESFLTESKGSAKKILNVILRADVQGSLEALKVALLKIESDKVDVNIIFTGVGEISESDVQLAAASKAVIIGFHTGIESHAEPLVKQYGVQIRLHDVIYHAIDSTKELMTGTLDRLAQEIPKGKAEVKAIFKSSQHGVIAGCQVIEGTIHRNNHVRVMREGVEVWKGSINSLKRHKDDVKEVAKGLECGILLSTNSIQQGDILDCYEVIYIKQEL